jgi:hypothetical protein
MAFPKRDYVQYALQVRVDENTAEAWKSEAASMGKSLSEFIRLAVDAGVLVLRAQDATPRGKVQSTRAGGARREDDRVRRHGRGKPGLKGRVSGRLQAKG